MTKTLIQKLVDAIPADTAMLPPALVEALNEARKALEAPDSREKHEERMRMLDADWARRPAVSTIAAQHQEVERSRLRGRVDELLAKNTELHNRHVEDQNALIAARNTIRNVERARDAALVAIKQEREETKGVFTLTGVQAKQMREAIGKIQAVRKRVSTAGTDAALGEMLDEAILELSPVVTWQRAKG